MQCISRPGFIANRDPNSLHSEACSNALVRIRLFRWRMDYQPGNPQETSDVYYHYGFPSVLCLLDLELVPAHCLYIH